MQSRSHIKGMYRPAGNCQDILNTQLLDAVCEKDVGTAKRLLNNGASVNIRTDMETTVLMLACWNCYKDKTMIDLLLKSGAAVNDADHMGWTALVYVTCEGDADICDWLLKHNADVMKKDIAGWTAIHFAAANNQKKVLEQLLQSSLHCACSLPETFGDIDNYDGCTPLWYAAENGHMDSVDVLLTHGANPDHRSKKDGSPLDIAKEKGHTTIVSMMTEALKLRSHRYVAGMITGMTTGISRLKEKTCKQETRINQLTKEKEQLQGKLKQSHRETKTTLLAAAKWVWSFLGRETITLTAVTLTASLICFLLFH